jgi:hypothetical protein
VSVALAALLLVPEVVLPRPLEVSAVSTDAVELERLATRLGPARLVRLAISAEAGGQPRVAAAALRGLGLAGSFHPEVAAQGLLPLVELVGRTQNDKLLAAATEALVRLCEGLHGASACAEPDDPGCGEDLSPVPSYMLQLAALPGLPLAVRSQLIQAVRALPVAAWRAQAQRLVALAQGPVPVRDAALAALGLLAQHHLERELTALALPPTGGELASCALAELCLPLPRRPARPTTATAPTLTPELAAQVRALAAGDQPLPQRQRLSDCLRLLGTPQDKQLLQSIGAAARRPRR